MLKIKIFIITILFFVACIFIYNNSLLLKLKKFLTEKNTNAGVAIIKNDKIWSNNHEKYPLLSVFKYFVAVKVLTGLEQKQISQDKKITITAEMIDKSVSFVGQVEGSGTVKGISLETLFKIAQVLNIPPSKLLEDD